MASEKSAAAESGLKNFRFLNSSFRSLYGAFMLQFSFVLPLSVAIANDERRYSVYLEGYLVMLNCFAIPALFVLHYVLWRVNHVSVHRWLYEKLLLWLRIRRRRKQSVATRTPSRPVDATTVLEMTAQVTEADCLTHDDDDGDGKQRSASPNDEEKVQESEEQVRMRTPIPAVQSDLSDVHDGHQAEPISAVDILMRIGAFGFGFAGMILNILRISDQWTNPTYCEYCRTAMSNAVFVCHILFYFIQTYFLFKHQSHRFPQKNRMVRFLLLHMVLTNIALWINAVVVEVMEDLHEKTYEYLRDDRTLQNQSFMSTYSQIKEHKTNMSKVLAEQSVSTRKQFLLYFCHSQELTSNSAATYLFPLLVEYFIISASILHKIYLSSYTMAETKKHHKKNRRSKSERKSSDGDEETEQDLRKDHCSCRDSYAGLIAGILLFLFAVASVVAFLIVLERKKIEEEEVLEDKIVIEEEDAAEREHKVSTNMTTHTSNKTTAASQSNLLSTTLATRIIMERKVKEAEEAMMADTIIALLIYQVAEILLVTPPMIACILLFCKFRAHFVMRRAHRSERIDVQQLFVGFLGVLTYNTFVIIASFERVTQQYALQVLTWIFKTCFSVLQSMLQICVITRGFRSMLPPGNTALMTQKPGRSLVMFLILANLALWLTNTFQMKYVDQVPDLYQNQASITPWSIVTHLLIPFTIFFRFHSTISFLHIWHVDYEEHSDSVDASPTHAALQHNQETTQTRKSD